MLHENKRTSVFLKFYLYEKNVLNEVHREIHGFFFFKVLKSRKARRTRSTRFFTMFNVTSSTANKFRSKHELIHVVEGGELPPCWITARPRSSVKRSKRHVAVDQFVLSRPTRPCVTNNNNITRNITVSTAWREDTLFRSSGLQRPKRQW